MNASLEAKVKNEDLKGVLLSFKKDKSNGLDDWTVEFYLGYYELLEEEILRVVEEP